MEAVGMSLNALVGVPMSNSRRAHEEALIKHSLVSSRTIQNPCFQYHHRQRLLVVKAKGKKGMMARQFKRPPPPSLPKIEDDGNPRFVVFIRMANAIQHAHSFSVKAFETRGELADLRKEFSALQKTQKRDQLRMKKLEEQAEAATKAQSIALQKAEAAVNVKKVAEAEKKEAEAKKAEAEKELRNALATKKAEIDAAYNQGMEDVAEDYKLQVKQACNKGFVLGWNAMAKQLDLPADSPWRKTKAMRLPCPLPSSQDESESEADAEDEEETLVRKTKSPPNIDLTGDEEVEAAPKKADFGTLSSDLLLVGRSVEETLAEIDAEVAADKGTEVAAEKETEVLAVNDAKVVEQGGAEEILPESSEVPIQPSAQVEQA